MSKTVRKIMRRARECSASENAFGWNHFIRKLEKIGNKFVQFHYLVCAENGVDLEIEETAVEKAYGKLDFGFL